MAENTPPPGAAGDAGPGPQSSRARLARNLLWGAAFTLLFAAAAWVRFDSITSLGISRGDGFKYVEAARKWAEGERTIRLGEGGDSAPYFRPAIYFLDSLAIRALGYNDSSVKILHASMDIANLMLLAWVAWMLGRRRHLALAAAGFYAFLPIVVNHSRSEFVHVPSATFVLIALAAFLVSAGVRGRPPLRWVLLALSGFSLGAAANIHPDLALLGPIFVVMIFAESVPVRPVAALARRAIPQAALFTAFFFSLYALAFLTFGAKEVTSAIADEATRHASATAPAPDALEDDPIPPPPAAPAPIRWFGDITQTFQHSFVWAFGRGRLVPVLFVLSIALLVANIAVGRPRQFRPAYPLLLLVGYAALYSFYSGAFYPSRARLFLPLIPMLACHFAFAFDGLLSRISPKYAPAALFALLGLFFFHVGRDFYSKPAADRALSLFPYRRVHAPLKDAVSPSAKLLIAPRAVYSNDKAYCSDLYFGSNAVYATDKTFEPPGLESFVEKNGIEFIYLVKWGYDTRKFGGSDPSPELAAEAASAGVITESQNQVAALMKEWQSVYEFVASRKGAIASLTSYGPVFHVPTGSPEHARKVIASSGNDFESGALDPNGRLAAVGLIDKSPGSKDGNSVRIRPRGRWYFRAELSDYVSLKDGEILLAEATTWLEKFENMSSCSVFVVFYGPEGGDNPQRPLGSAGPINTSTANMGWAGVWLRESRAIHRFEQPPGAERARIELFVGRARAEDSPALFVDDVQLSVLRWGPELALPPGAPAELDQ